MNKITQIKLADAQGVPVSTLSIGQLFNLKGAMGTERVGVITVFGQGRYSSKYGILFDKGTYVDEDTKVLPLPPGTEVTLVAE